MVSKRANCDPNSVKMDTFFEKIAKVAHQLSPRLPSVMHLSSTSLLRTAV